MAVSDWDRRELCSDGSCTGLIGVEGTCKVCGRVAPNWGEERMRGTQEIDDDEADDEVDDDPIKPATPVAIGGGEWTVRTLCSDGSCVGVIGSDGKCKVCGKPGNPSAVGPEGDEDDGDEDEDEDEDEDDGDEEGEDDDEEDAELAAAADELAGVAAPSEVASAKAISADADDEADRKLCPDGGCVGLIGANGKCKVCGKEAAA
jgi:hypothetical protein